MSLRSTHFRLIFFPGRHVVPEISQKMASFMNYNQNGQYDPLTLESFRKLKATRLYIRFLTIITSYTTKPADSHRVQKSLEWFMFLDVFLPWPENRTTIFPVH
jgi:hypothetical protein